MRERVASIFALTAIILATSSTVAGSSQIWIEPNSFDVNIIEGCTLTKILTIGNNGDTALNFMIRTQLVDGSATLGDSTDQLSTTSDAGVLSVSKSRDFTVMADVPYKQGELIVRFATKDGGRPFSLAEKKQILSSLGRVTIKRNLRIIPGLSVVKLPAGMTVKNALKKLNKAGNILYAEPNYKINALSIFPDDPRFNDLWAMNNTGQTGGTVDADIDAPEAWELVTGSGEIIVAVIDTGVDYTHPDLADNMWINQAEFDGAPGVDDDNNGYVDDIYGYDFCDNDSNPMDDGYHGTHCAGTIGGIGNNAEGVTGVNWNVRIMAVKCLDNDGYGWTSDAIESVEYSTLMGANILSNSWGGAGYSQTLKDAIDAAGAAGMLCVAAAGNDNENTDMYPLYPASYDSESIIAVSATDEYDNMADFSNYGLASVDLSAPGVDILSCKMGGGYQYDSGTSMATPHVAGACALLWSMNPAMSNTELKDILLQTVDKIPALAGKCVSEGRLNLYNAVLKSEVPWIDIEPKDDSVGPGESNDISITFNSIDMAPGIYEAEIIIVSNDPCSPTIVPVTMTVNPDDLQVIPNEGFDSSGNEGGPFAPNCKTYTLTNINDTNSVTWTTSEIEDWLYVEPNVGVLDPCESTDVNLCFSSKANLLDLNRYTQTLIFQNTDSNSIKQRPVTLKVKPPDFFTESFDEHDNGMAGFMMTFRPDGSTNYYEACRQKVSVIPTDPNGGTFVSLWDDDSEEIILSGGAEVLFYGQWYDRFYIGSNGYITFGGGDTEYTANLENHFNMPRISPLFTDLTPPNNQCISFKQLDDRVVITFEDVPLYGDKNAKNTFQAEMFFVDGAIRITWLNIAATTYVVGLSQGNGIPPILFEQSNLYKYPPCWPLGDFDRDYSVSFTDFAILAMHWLDVDCNIPYWCGKTDLDFSDSIDEIDLDIFSENWLITEDWFLQPIAYWKFDEYTGSTAHDSSGYDNHAAVEGAEWTTGQTDGALRFDGNGDYAETTTIYDIHEPITISTWIKTNGSDNIQTIFGRNKYTQDYYYQNFLRIDTDNKVLFGDIPNSSSDPHIVSTYSIETDKWYHIVITRASESDIKLYTNGTLDNSGSTISYQNPGISYRIGTINSGHHSFNGKIDDVKIYDRVLSEKEIMQLYYDGLSKKATCPNPADEEILTDPNSILSWTPGYDANSHNVYLGTDFNDVNNATIDSNEYMGNYDSNSYDPCGLESDTTYYWRIDEKNTNSTIKGDTWSFTIIDANLINFWKFDEGAGTIAYDSVGSNDGTLVGYPNWTTGQIDGALLFDGDDDYVLMNSVCADGNTGITWCLWLNYETAGTFVLDQRQNNTGYQPIYIGKDSYEGDLQFYSSDTADNSYFNTNLQTNKWYHVAMVLDNSIVACYVDGSFVDSKPDTNYNFGTKDLHVGTRHTISGCFKGLIDDVRIYDRTLSDEQILQIYQNGLH